MTPLAINGVEDHIHILVGIPGPLAISTAVQTIKANTSRWIRERRRLFSWQEGFCSFSVSSSNLSSVSKYIARQAEHQERRRFEDELIAMLEKHNIAYDREHIFG